MSVVCRNRCALAESTQAWLLLKSQPLSKCSERCRHVPALALTTQEAKGVETPVLARAKQLLGDIEHASKEAPVYFRGRASVFAKSGTGWLSRMVSC